MTEGSEPRDGLLKAITSRTAMGGAGEQQTNCTQREWCPVLRVPPAAAIGAPGEQKHLPDVITHQGSKNETLYDDFSRPDERKRKEVPMRDLNYDLKQL